MSMARPVYPQLKTFLCTGLHRKPLRGDAARVSWEAEP